MDYSESSFIGYLDFMYGIKITSKLKTFNGTFRISHKLAQKI
jgi:hypothetical protein